MVWCKSCHSSELKYQCWTHILVNDRGVIFRAWLACLSAVVISSCVRQLNPSFTSFRKSWSELSKPRPNLNKQFRQSWPQMSSLRIFINFVYVKGKKNIVRRPEFRYFYPETYWFLISPQKSGFLIPKYGPQSHDNQSAIPIRLLPIVEFPLK